MKTNNDNDLSHHILPNSATMVGVCIMVISIVKSMPPDTVNYLIDKALAVDSLLFMISALLSFLSIRLERSTLALERWAEIIFILGLVSMTMINLVFAFEIG
jgi:multisubunit Na+/H+ antiporter MnhF subunit